MTDGAGNSVMRPTLIRFSLLLAMACSASAGIRNSGGAAPRVTFAETAISATGLTPNRRVVVFGAAREALGHSYRMARWSSVTVADATGQVTYDLGRRVSANSIWCIADLTSGEYTVASPRTYDLRITSFPPNAFRKGAGADEFSFRHPFLDMLYVHPGQGAWTAEVAEGSALDRDGPNGTIVLSLADMTPLDGAPKLHTFVPGGVLVAIDLFRAEVAVIRLDTPTLSAGGPR